MPLGDVAPELAVALGAVVTLAAALSLPRRSQAWAALPALAALAVAAASTASLAAAPGPRLSFHGTWALDRGTALARLTALAAAAVVVALSPRWFERDRRHGDWYALLLLATLGPMLLGGAADLSALLVAVLLSSVTATTLASFHRGSRASAEAGAKRFFLGALATPCLFLGVVILFALAGATGHGELARVLVTTAPDRLALGAGVGLVSLGLTLELGAFPFHPWVPDVAEGAPAPAAAFLTVAPKAAALVATARLLAHVPEEALAWRPAMAALALVTMTVGNLAALWQTDLRRLLGWSSVAQVGFGLLAVVALGRSPHALQALGLFVVAYAAGNLAAFGVVVSLRGRTRLEDYAGLAWARPLHAAALGLALFSLFGVPPLVGFGAKLLLFAAAIEAGYAWLALAGVLHTAISLFYTLRVVAPMVLGHPARRPALLGRTAAATALATAAALLALGVAAELLLAPLAGG